MTVNSTATVAYLFKVDYARVVADTVMRMHPTLMNVVRRDMANVAGHGGDFVGISFNYPMKFGHPQGISNLFPNAQNQASTSKGVQFVATSRLKYGLVQVDGPSIRACKDDGAFTDLVALAVDDTMTAQINQLGFDVFRSKYGIRGRRTSISVNTIQLETIDDARNFEIDQTIGASPNADGSSPRTGSTTVTAINLTLGQVTVASAAAITAFANNDYLFNYGDPPAFGSSGCVDGMEDSTPVTAPTAGDSFRSVDRSVYVERLAGSRIDTTTSANQTFEESIGQGATFVNTVGGVITDAAINPLNFWQIVRRRNAQVVLDPGGEVTYGFERVRIATGVGTITLWSDPDCPTNRIRGFNRDSHYMRKNGELVHVIDEDGMQNLRGSSTDSLEARTRFIGNYIQNNTRDHFVVAV